MNYLESGFNENLIRIGYSGVESNGVADSALLAQIAADGAIPTTEVTGALATGKILDANRNLITNIINANLDTQSKQILGSFIFGASGAIAIATDANNGLWISPTGILAKKAGANTLAIDASGNATFSGAVTAATITGGSITGADIYASSSGSNSNVHIYNTAGAGQVDLLYAGAQKAFFAANSTTAIIGAHAQLNIQADNGIFMSAGDWLQLVYNYGGGGDVFQVSNDGGVVFQMDDANDAWFASNLYATSDIRCGGTFKSSDGSSGANFSSMGFVTAGRMNGASWQGKWREITCKDGLITNLSSESGWS